MAGTSGLRAFAPGPQGGNATKGGALPASEVDPGGFGPWERDGLAVVEGNDEHGGGEQVPDPTQQPGSGRSIEALGRFVEQEDVGPARGGSVGVRSRSISLDR